MPTLAFQFLLGGIIVLLSTSAPASIIAYWQFDDAADGIVSGAGSVQDSSANGFDGSGQGVGVGAAPVYSSFTVNPTVYDGLTGSIVNPDNTTSLRFDNVGGIDSTIGSVVQIPGSNSLLKPQDFTVEGFVFYSQEVNYPTLIGKSRSGGTTWVVDLGNNETLRVRADHQDPGLGGGNPGYNQGFGGGTASAANPSYLDGQWHHFAVTFEQGTGGSTGQFRLYTDYLLVATGNLNNGDAQLVYDDGALYIGDQTGGRAFEGWLDEFRITDQVLTPDQFLFVIPEPSGALGLIGLIGAMILRRGRRRIGDSVAGSP